MYANYAVGFSAPGVSDLYRGVKVPSLQPSTYQNYEAGGWLTFAKKKGYLEVSIYQLDGTNEIINVQQDDGSTEKENAGKTQHRGIEYTLRYSPSKSIGFRFGGTNAQHLFLDYNEKGNNLEGNEMSSAPKFIANAEFTYRPQFLSGSRIALEWQHISPYFLDANNTETYRISMQLKSA